MPHPDLAVVTGAFSYTGRYVARRLLDQGVHVRTLTRSPDAENLFAGQVETAPLDFSDADGLRRSMQGAGVFYNTYWIPTGYGTRTEEQPSTSRWRTRGRCSRPLRVRASAG